MTRKPGLCTYFSDEILEICIAWFDLWNQKALETRRDPSRQQGLMIFPVHWILRAPCQVQGRGRGGCDTDSEGYWVFGPVFFRNNQIGRGYRSGWKEVWEDPPPHWSSLTSYGAGVVECLFASKSSPINFEMHFNITQPVRSRAWLELTREWSL